MNNYLDNLVTRAFNLGDAIQPEFASLFAQTPNQFVWQGYDSSANVDFASDEHTFGELESDSPSLHQFFVSQREQSDGYDVPAKPDMTPELPAGHDVTNSPRAVSHQEPALISRPLAEQPPEERIVQTLVQDRIIVTRQASPNKARNRVSRTDDGKSRSSILGSPSSSLETTLVQIAPYKTFSSGDTPTPAQPLVAPTAFAPVKSRVVDERALAPTIRVNIGRIEVRAITPPAAQPRPKRTRSGPALSLEDYLKQRNGRQR